MKIVDHRELDPTKEQCVSVTKVGGKFDGETFRGVIALLEDGSTAGVFKSSARPGYFKQVFVPWDFNNPKVID